MIRNGEKSFITKASLAEVDDSYYGIHFSQEIPEGCSIKFKLVNEDFDDKENLDNEAYNSVVAESKVQEDLSMKSSEKSTSNEDGFFTNIWRWITDTAAKVGEKISEILCKLLLVAGDAFLHMITIAVGEKSGVTIDKVVYNDLEKTDINFFVSGDTAKNAHPLKDVMRPVISTWYSIFLEISILVYLVLLVYTGLKILLNSTAEKKASYKSVFSAWILGIFMLFLFPYVIKYTIELNDALCKWCASIAADSDAKEASINSKGTSVEDYYKYYGSAEFPMVMAGGNASDAQEVENFKNNAIKDDLLGSNVILKIRLLAQAKRDVALIVIYYILIGQLLALLVMYYKRVFMTAFLITIFPLVVAFYPINKMGDVRLNCFGVWFKEFVINVATQAFHAVIYTVVVLVGLNSYLKNDNWLFMILCIFFLFEGEKIIRAIFSAKSSMNTIGDIAASGALAWGWFSGAQKSLSNIGKGGSKKAGAADTDANELAESDRQAAAGRNTGLGGTTGSGILPTGDAPDGSGGSPTGSDGGRRNIIWSCATWKTSSDCVR